MSKQVKGVPNKLREAAKVFEEKNAEYGNSYQEHGKIMEVLFPDGVELMTPEDQNRFAIFTTMVSKMYRYAANWEEGHDDSLLDISVYANMLRELDGEMK